MDRCRLVTTKPDSPLLCLDFEVKYTWPCAIDFCVDSKSKHALVKSSIHLEIFPTHTATGQGGQSPLAMQVGRLHRRTPWRIQG